MHMRRLGACPMILVVALAAAALAACGGADEQAAPADATEPATVFAAASLTEVFPQIDSDARYNFAGSDDLAAQIREGAPADVYASASSKYTQQLFDEGLVEQPVTFASNELVLIVPADNPAGIETIEDVTKPGTRLVVAAEGVPVGDYTREVLQDLELSAALDNVVSNEPDVKAVVSKVSLGEADAGFVYATDAAAAGDDVTVIELPEGSQPPIEYQIAVVEDSENQDAAHAFVDDVMSSEGQQQLAAAGFLPPP
jgi:molybdate transport system substrate-binding protein